MSEPSRRPCVVVGFDGSPAAHAALDRGIERAGETGKLFLVYAWAPPEGWRSGSYEPHLHRTLDEAEGEVERARAAHPRLAGIQWESELIAGPAATAIIDVASARDADEIVVGTRGVGRVRGLLGSVAHAVIHAATCPVTVIPASMTEQDSRDTEAA
jgi:nucleotide-binding universal stress UspA family protein